jgi:hypothetical protein
MYAAAASKGGAGGVPQSVGKEFVATDKPGKLPAHKHQNKRETMYDHASSKRARSRT